MKKINIILVVIVAAVLSFVACNTNTSTKVPNLENQIDSLNYAFGLANGSDMVMSLAQDSDSIDYRVNSFVKGFKEGISGAKEEQPQFSGVGREFGNWLNRQKEVGLMGDSALKVNYELVRQGLINSIKNDKVQITPEQAQEYINKTMKARQERVLEKQHADKKATAIKYMEDNKNKPDIITTASGLQYEILKNTNGVKPTAEDMVKVHYEGKLTDGTVFDSSIERGEPTPFTVNEVIPGWKEGLQLMPVGSKFRFYIPYNLAYGATGTPSIPPFSPLIFEVELISIEK